MLTKTIHINTVDELFSVLQDTIPCLFSQTRNGVALNADMGNVICTKTKITGTSKYRIDIKTEYDEYLMYFYVEEYQYYIDAITSRSTLLITPYYSGDTLINNSIPRENTNNYGPSVVYNKNNSLYSKSGFININSNMFIVDSLTVCYNDSNVPHYFVAFNCEEQNESNFIISITNNNNFGVIGVTSTTDEAYNVCIISHYNNTTQDHNLYKIQIKDSSITAMTKLFLPESTIGEYFDYVYLVYSLETNDVNLSKYIYNKHIYLPCLNNYVATLTY